MKRKISDVAVFLRFLADLFPPPLKPLIPQASPIVVFCKTSGKIGFPMPTATTYFTLIIYIPKNIDLKIKTPFFRWQKYYELISSILLRTIKNITLNIWFNRKNILLFAFFPSSLVESIIAIIAINARSQATRVLLTASRTISARILVLHFAKSINYKGQCHYC